MQAIFKRARSDSKSETWNDLYKKDLLEALLKRGLKRWECQETANLILEEAMLFTSIIGMDLVKDLANTNEQIVKGVQNANEVDQKVGEIDH